MRPGAHPPRPRNSAHGTVRWAVLLASARQPRFAALQELFEHVSQTLHYEATLGDRNCTAPAEGALPAAADPGEEGHVLVLTFRNEREARAFSAALATPPPWVGRVRVMCAD